MPPGSEFPVTDDSQEGQEPDPYHPGEPEVDNEPTEITFGSALYDPPFGVKILDSSNLPVIQWTMIWINDSNLVGVHAAVSDPIPEGTAYVAGSVVCIPAIGAPPSPTHTDSCGYETASVDYPRGRIYWTGVVGPDWVNSRYG
jgi:uncharacterized repeat protein (TIGR01451 family)